MQIRAFDQIVSFGLKSKDIGGGIHPYYELLFISKGIANIQWMGKDYHVSAPALLLFSPSTPHWVFKQSPEFSCWFIELQIDDKNDAPNLHTISLWNKMQTSISNQAPELESIQQSVNSISHALNQKLNTFNPSIWSTVIIYQIKIIFTLIQHFIDRLLSNKSIIEHFDIEESNLLDNEIVELIRYLESYYTSKITLQTLVKQIHLSPSYLIKLFKEKTGMTPFQYLHELRMNAAICYLKATHLTVSEIAEETGYSNIHYFSRLFKESFGESPSSWRNKNKIQTDQPLDLQL